MDIDRLPLIAIDRGSNNAVIPFEWCIMDVIDWKRQLEELVARQREMMIEY